MVYDLKTRMPVMIERYCYLILSLILISIETIRINIGDWGGYFWEHAAAINELCKRPLNPSRPMLNIDLTHVFFSPYSLLLAMFSKWFGWGISAALLNSKSKGDSLNLKRLKSIDYTFPKENRKLCYEGIKQALQPAITPKLDSALWLDFNKIINGN